MLCGWRTDLLRQGLVNARPALRTCRMQPLDGRIDLPARRLRHPTELLGRQHDGDVVAAACDAHGLGLRHANHLAKAVLGIGGGEGFHAGRLAKLADFVLPFGMVNGASYSAIRGDTAPFCDAVQR